MNKGFCTKCNKEMSYIVSYSAEEISHGKHMISSKKETANCSYCDTEMFIKDMADRNLKRYQDECKKLLHGDTPVEKQESVTVNLTNAQAKFLKEFAFKQYPGADANLATSYPIHSVQTRRERVINPEYEESDMTIYKYSGDSESHYESPEELVASVFESNEIRSAVVCYEDVRNKTIINHLGEEAYICDEDDYFKAYGIDEEINIIEIAYYYEPVAFFFILDQAKAYIKYQAHNLTEPRTFTYCGDFKSNGDFAPFWDVLMNMGQQLNESSQ